MNEVYEFNRAEEFADILRAIQRVVEKHGFPPKTGWINIAEWLDRRLTALDRRRR